MIKSSSQAESLDELIKADQNRISGIEEAPSMEFDMVDVATWPDEDKPKIEERYRRKYPVHHSQCAWVLLGNDEEWLIPELEVLGKDVHFEEQRGVFGKLIGIKASGEYRHHKQIRELVAKVTLIIEQSEDKDGEFKFDVPWEEAYLLMYMVLKVNYKIPCDDINDMGLLRQEHFWPVFSALCGFKKKLSGKESVLPVPSMG